jgi:hypothetical protein
MSSAMLIATACLVLLGVFHSYLGERFLIGPLLASPHFPELKIDRPFAKGTLRFAWHLTTLAWLGMAYQLARGECSPGPVAAVLALSGVLTHVGTRGRHAAWAVFLLGAVALSQAALQSTLVPRTAALVGSVLLAAIGGLHVAWVFGLRWGSAAAVPERAGRALFSPGPAITLAVACALFVASWLLLALAAIVPAPVSAPWLWAFGLVAACVFGLRTIGDGRFVGLSKRVTGTRFARFDDAVFTPLCFVLCTALALQLI